MRIIECPDYASMSRRAAAMIAAQVLLKPDCVLGLATGSTPVGAYRELVKWNREGLVSFKEARSVNLDEYLGLAPEHEQSYRRFMQENLFDHIDIVPENTHVLNGLAADPDAECAAYDAMISSLGGIDLQLLGMGHNGHIAFNEPGDDFGLGAHVVTLSERTIDANRRFFASRDEVPRRALSMGIRSIMLARRNTHHSLRRGTRPRPSRRPSPAPSRTRCPRAYCSCTRTSPSSPTARPLSALKGGRAE